MVAWVGFRRSAINATEWSYVFLFRLLKLYYGGSEGLVFTVKDGMMPSFETCHHKYMVNSQSLIYQKTQYLTSSAEFRQLPPDVGGEVAFIGRSNAGKSSALNAITCIKGLARTSKIPGRTQMINFFCVNVDCRLVDLPGYGYAKVPRMVQELWERNVDRYLRERRCLRGLVIVMDIRHPLRDMDHVIIRWAAKSQVPVHVLLTKSDKVSRYAANKTRQEVSAQLVVYRTCTLQLFSAHDRTGVEEARAILDRWYAGQV